MRRVSRFSHILDETLVLHVLLGNMQAFDELVRRYRGAVILTAAQTLGSHCSAEDAAQEAFLLAFKALPQLTDHTKFAGWLCAITKRTALRIALRDSRSEPMEPSRLDQVILAHSRELGADPAAEFARTARHGRIQEAVAQLPSDYHAVLQLHYEEAWPVRRIAAFYSLPITTVKWRLHHGRELMRRYLLKKREESSDDD